MDKFTDGQVLLIIVAVLVAMAFIRTKLERVDRPLGKTDEERFANICEKAHYRPVTKNTPEFVSKSENLALTLSELVYVPFINGNRISNVVDTQDIASINFSVGNAKAGGIIWGLLYVACKDGRQGSMRIPNNEIDDFMAAWRKVQGDLREFQQFEKDFAEMDKNKD